MALKVKCEENQRAKFLEKLASTLSPMNLTYILFIQNDRPFSKHAKKKKHQKICLSAQQYQNIMMEDLGKWET